MAQAAATIDRLSNGRFMLGIGTGEMINEDPLGFEKSIEECNELSKLGIDKVFFTVPNVAKITPKITPLEKIGKEFIPQIENIELYKMTGIINTHYSPS